MGAAHVTVMVPSVLGAALVMVALPGIPNGVVCSDGSDSTPSPLALTPVTVNRYLVPLVSPVKVPEEGPETVWAGRICCCSLIA